MNKYNLYFLFLTFIHILQMKCAYFSFGFDSAISPFNSSDNAFFYMPRNNRLISRK